ncbi:hypothetical protein HHI36_007056 [Cryptolaemus montrouzieri]|uniref:Uncharacterized protein n=1 Tax=Cryptolaemus montrouzieri TaxID=559131 RepID=A0ABD2MNC5_9CUCU
MLPNESPYTPQRLYFNPNPYLANNIPNYNQNPFYNQNPYYDPYLMQNSFYKPHFQTFRPSPLIYTGLEQISSSDSFISSTTPRITTTSTTTTSTSTSTTTTTTPLPITTTTSVPTTTSGPKEHLTEAAYDVVPKKTIMNFPTKSTKNKHRSPIRTNYVKIPVISPNKKKPIRHMPALVRPSSHQIMNSMKHHNHLMHSASFHYPVKVPLNSISNTKPSFRIRPNNARPNANSQFIYMQKPHLNNHLTKKPSNVIILTPQVKLVTKSPNLATTSTIVVKESKTTQDSNNLSPQKTETESLQMKHDNLGEQNTLEIIYPVKKTILKPHEDVGFHPENIKIEKGFTPILERSDLMISSDEIFDRKIGEPTPYLGAASLKSNKLSTSKKYSRHSKRSEPNYFRMKIKFSRDLEETGLADIREEPTAQASSKQIYYLPPDDQKQTPTASISQPSNIDIIPEESDTDIAPDVVVTYDGKKVSGASLTARLPDTTKLLEPKSLKTSEFIRTRPQSVPFKGELPPLGSSISFPEPDFNTRGTLNRNLDAPLLHNSQNSHGSTKLARIQNIPHANANRSKTIRRKRSPHHTPEHTAEQKNSKNSGYSPTSSIILTVVVSHILLIK